MAKPPQYPQQQHHPLQPPQPHKPEPQYQPPHTPPREVEHKAPEEIPHPVQATLQTNAGSVMTQIRSVKNTIISQGIFTKVEADHYFEQIMKDLNIKMQYPLSG